MPGFKIDVFVDDTCRGEFVGKNNPNRREAKTLHTIETARNHRYSLNILGFEEISAYARSIDRPTYKPEHMVIHHGMQLINRPGKIAWEPITVVFYEILSSDAKIDRTAETIYGWFVDDGYTPSQNNNQTTDIASGRSTIAGPIYNIRNNTITHKNCKDVEIMLENGMGDYIWKYKLINAWPGIIEADTLDYTNNDISHIKMTLIYDRAVNLITQGGDNARV